MKSILILFILLFSGFRPVVGQQDIFSTSSGAIRGYDPVAYFTQGKAIEGSENLNYEWKGATWHFSSEMDRDLFMENPGKYAPQYGGYCAYAMANGQKAKIDPEAWSIVDGKLYLNYNKRIQGKWEEKQDEYIRKADEEWGSMD